MNISDDVYKTYIDNTDPYTIKYYLLVENPIDDIILITTRNKTFKI